VVLCRTEELAAVRSGLQRRFYAGRTEFDEHRHLIVAEPGPGALSPRIA
jgi:hypothetical protein